MDTKKLKDVFVSTALGLGAGVTLAHVAHDIGNQKIFTEVHMLLHIGISALSLASAEIAENKRGYLFSFIAGVLFAEMGRNPDIWTTAAQRTLMP